MHVKAKRLIVSKGQCDPNCEPKVVTHIEVCFLYKNELLNWLFYLGFISFGNFLVLNFHSNYSVIQTKGVLQLTNK